MNAFIKTVERFLVRYAEDPEPSPDETCVPVADADTWRETGKWAFVDDVWVPGKVVWDSEIPGWKWVPDEPAPDNEGQ